VYPLFRCIHLIEKQTVFQERVKNPVCQLDGFSFDIEGTGMKDESIAFHSLGQGLSPDCTNSQERFDILNGNLDKR
jgi:hypothetical protein